MNRSLDWARELVSGPIQLNRNGNWARSSYHLFGGVLALGPRMRLALGYGFY